MISFYRPQHSCGKVIFSQASVILSTWGVFLPACTGADTPPPRQTGDVYPSMHWSRHTPSPGADTPQADTPLGQTPPGQTPPGQTPPLGQTPPPPDGHCSGMLSCCKNIFFVNIGLLYQEMVVLRVLDKCAIVLTCFNCRCLTKSYYRRIK